MLGFLWMCIIGLVASALANWIMPGKDPGGILVAMLLGIAGFPAAGFFQGQSDRQPPGLSPQAYLFRLTFPAESGQEVRPAFDAILSSFELAS